MSDRNVRSPTIRKAGRDGPELTPTEKHRKAQLMRQFLRRDGQQGNTAEYQANYEQIDWSKG